MKKKKAKSENAQLTKAELHAKFLKFLEGKKAEDLFPEKDKRAYENLTKAVLL